MLYDLVCSEPCAVFWSPPWLCVCVCLCGCLQICEWACAFVQGRPSVAHFHHSMCAYYFKSLQQHVSSGCVCICWCASVHQLESAHVFACQHTICGMNPALWVESSIDREGSGAGVKPLTFYTLKNLCAVQTPHPFSPLPPPISQPSCSFASIPPPIPCCLAPCARRP